MDLGISLLVVGLAMCIANPLTLLTTMIMDNKKSCPSTQLERRTDVNHKDTEE